MYILNKLYDIYIIFLYVQKFRSFFDDSLCLFSFEEFLLIIHKINFKMKYNRLYCFQLRTVVFRSFIIYIAAIRYLPV